jgi:hypothetical protein
MLLENSRPFGAVKTRFTSNPKSPKNMKTRHLLPVMVLLVAVASVHAVKLGPSGWVIGTEEANGIVGFLPGVTVSAYDNVIVAISGNSPLDAGRNCGRSE